MFLIRFFSTSLLNCMNIDQNVMSYYLGICQAVTIFDNSIVKEVYDPILICISPHND